MTYEDNAPIFVCDTCGHKDTTWQKFYKEYLQMFRIKENWGEAKNYVTCLIGMFCYLYQEKYKLHYTFVPTTPNPYGSKECRDAWALLAAFDGKAEDARKYMYWVFNHAITNSTNITSFGYLNAPGLVRKYKLKEAKKYQLNRASKLPEVFIEWCSEFAVEIFDSYQLETMNDLGALSGYVLYYDKDLLADSVEKRAIKQAERLGLVKDGKINIGDGQ